MFLGSSYMPGLFRFLKASCMRPNQLYGAKDMCILSPATEDPEKDLNANRGKLPVLRPEACRHWTGIG